MPAIKRCGAFLMSLVVSLSAGYGGVIWAAPDALLWQSSTVVSPGTENFSSPAAGFLTSTAGDVYAVGVGTIYDTDVTFTRERESSALRDHVGVIVNTDYGLWVFSADYEGSAMAKSHYVPTGLFPSHEDYSAKAKGACELAGDFGYVLSERLVQVYKSGSPLEETPYNVTSYINPTIVYGDGGIATADTPDDQTGIALDEGVFGGPYANTLFGENTGQGVGVYFSLYAGAWHAVETNEEEDVTLTTKIEAGTAQDSSSTQGWFGDLQAYDVSGDMTYMALLQWWPFGN